MTWVFGAVASPGPNVTKPLKRQRKTLTDNLCQRGLRSGAKESRTPDLFVANERAHRRNACKTSCFRAAVRKCPRLCGNTVPELPFLARPSARRTGRTSSRTACRDRHTAYPALICPERSDDLPEA